MKRHQIRIVVVPPTGAPFETSIVPDLEHFQSMVGGYIQAIEVGPGAMFFNENGKFENLLLNSLATNLCFDLQAGLAPDDYVCGPAILVGPPDADGDDQDAPEQFLAWAKEHADG